MSGKYCGDTSTQKNIFLGNKLPENLIFPLVELCLHQGCFAAEGRKRSQHCKCPRRHIRIATTIKIHELSMESLQSHFKIKIAQLRESGHYSPSRARRNDTCVRRRAASSAQNVPQPSEAAVVLSRQHVVTSRSHGS